MAQPDLQTPSLLVAAVASNKSGIMSSAPAAGASAQQPLSSHMTCAVPPVKPPPPTATSSCPPQVASYEVRCDEAGSDCDEDDGDDGGVGEEEGNEGGMLGKSPSSSSRALKRQQEAHQQDQDPDQDDDEDQEQITSEMVEAEELVGPGCHHRCQRQAPEMQQVAGNDEAAKQLVSLPDDLRGLEGTSKHKHKHYTVEVLPGLPPCLGVL